MTELKKKQGFELQMWIDWKNSGQKPEQVKPLLQSFKPLLANKTYQLSISGGGTIPKEAIEAEVNKNFLAALRTYNPAKAQLNTHIEHHLKKAKRFVDTYKYIGRIPDHRVGKVHDYLTTKQNLTDSLDREPSTMEMATELKWSQREVGRLEKELRKELLASGFEALEQSDPFSVLPSEEGDILNLIRYELTPEELQVYEYTLGLNGKPRLQPGQIATKIHISSSKVSRIKESIAKKIGRYTGATQMPGTKLGNRVNQFFLILSEFFSEHTA